MKKEKSPPPHSSPPLSTFEKIITILAAVAVLAPIVFVYAVVLSARNHAYANTVTATLSGTVTGGFDGQNDPPGHGEGLFLSTSGPFSGQGFTVEFTINDGLGVSTSVGSPPYESQISSTTSAGSPITEGKITINGVSKSLGNLPTSTVSSSALRETATPPGGTLEFTMDDGYGIGDFLGDASVTFSCSLNSPAYAPGWDWESALSYSYSGSKCGSGVFYLERGYYDSAKGYYSTPEFSQAPLSATSITVSGPQPDPPQMPTASGGPSPTNNGPPTTSPQPNQPGTSNNCNNNNTCLAANVASSVGTGLLFGEPINAGTGNVYLAETDYTGAPSTHLYFVRHYNSYDSSLAGFGVGWHSTYHRGLAVTGSTVTVTLATGKQESFTQNMSGQYVGPANVPDTLSVYPFSGTQTGWLFTTAPDDNVELYTLAGQLTSITTRAGLTTSLSYNGSGQLTTVTGPFGHTLTFTYTPAGNVATMTDPASNVFHYGYDASDNLAYVEYPDSTYRWYQYLGGYPDIITGIVDENANLWASWGYDSYGRATSSQLAGGVNAASLNYTATGTTIATDANGNSHTYNYQANQGLLVTTSLSGQPYPPAGGQAFTYDANGFVSSITDFNGNVTALTHNSVGEETSRTDAYGTGLARTTTTTWISGYHLPYQIFEPLRTTTYAYDGSGNVLSKSVTDGTHTRTWQWSYNASGLPLTTTDPDGNGTVMAYSTTGYLASITNPLGQTTTYSSYDANGRVLTMTDPNSLTTTWTYDKRGRVLTRTVGTEETKWAYDYVGNLTKLTFPDSSYLTYTYDAAHRLTDICDVAGDCKVFGYDANSNLTGVQVYNATPTLEQQATYAYDAVNRLASKTGAYSGETTYYGYDSQSNLVSVTNPLGNTTTNYYDALNRRIETVDPLGDSTTYGYDTQDDLTSVSDPRGLTTSYSYDGIGDQTGISSPDAGATVLVYDAAGNVLTSTDALGNTTTNYYDALNRTTTVQYAGGGSIGYLWDSGTYGIGHLARISDLSGTTSYTYDQHGRTLTMKQTTTGSVALTVTDAYDSYGRLHTVEYPSTKTITLGYDTSGRINSVSPGATSISYFPFGPATQWTENNGTPYERAFDQDGRQYWEALYATATSITNQQTLTYDVNSRVTELQETGLNTKYYGYDNLDRLTAYFDGTTTNSYNYDADGNRTYTTAAAGTTTYSTSGSSNWLTGLSGVLSATNTYNADGNLTGDGTFTYSYDGRGRMSQALTGTSSTNYQVNGIGQRTVKAGANVGNGGTNEFVYDQQGHMLGEYGSTGTNIDETVWLPNTPVAALYGGYGTPTPVAVLTGSTGTTISSLSADWLGAPHIIQNSSKVSQWTWDHAAFGDGIPNNNPSGLGAFTYNLGFPGQHYDAETAHYYNGFRDYNQLTGRYIEADPLGLGGGQASLYPYGGGNPLSHIDPNGLLCYTVNGNPHCDDIPDPRTWRDPTVGPVGQSAAWAPAYIDWQCVVDHFGTATANKILETIGTKAAALHYKWVHGLLEEIEGDLDLLYPIELAFCLQECTHLGPYPSYGSTGQGQTPGPNPLQ